jgi:hypothetical protein
MADTHRDPVPGGTRSRISGSVGAGATTHRRPGMLTFAAVMMFVVAGFEALSALFPIAGTGWWVTSAGDLVYATFVFWGIIVARV